MFVYYNNERVEVKEHITILQLLSQFEEVEHKAVWLNGRHVPLENFNTVLRSNDEIRVVRIRGGG